MANESINLNLIPKGEMPVIHVSQFDNGRQFTINLLKGSDEYTLPVGYTAVLNCRKADRNIVTLATTSVLSNALTFTTTTQLCACAGKNLCEVVIKDAEDYQVGTLNFILEVEKDPLQGGIESTSEIHDLETQIEDITTEIISENYYTKTETDTLLDAKADAADLALVATTGSYNDLNSLPKLNGMTITGNRNAQWYGLASKLNDLSDVSLSPELSESEILIYNSYLNKWINSKMSYTWLIDKPSIPDAQIQSDYAQSDDTKVDYIKNKPDISGMIEQAIYNILPASTVTGQSVIFNTDLAIKPDAITISNSATKIYVFGKNLFNGVYETSYDLFLPAGLTVTASAIKTEEQVPFIYYYDINGELIDYWGLSSVAEQRNYRTFTIDRDCYSVKFMIADASDIMIELNNTPTDYELYNNNSTEYLASDINNVTCLSGNNTIFTDNGDISVTYRESIQHYIDRKVGS